MNKKELKLALNRTDKELDKLNKYMNGIFDSGFEPYIYITDNNDRELFRIHLKNFNPNYHQVIDDYIKDLRISLLNTKDKILNELIEKLRA